MASVGHNTISAVIYFVYPYLVVYLSMEKNYPSQFKGPISVNQVMNYGKLLDGVFSVKESGINSKIFHSWKLDNLLPTVPKGSWAELSFIDYLWLRTLETMRKFGCSKKLMKYVCNELFIKAYEINLSKVTLKESVSYLTSLSSSRPITINEEEYLATCIAELNDPIRMATTEFGINYFYQLVVKCFVTNNEVGLIIFEDGQFDIYEQPNEGHIPIDISNPYLFIQISSFIKKFVVDEEKDQFLKPTGILDEQEYEVIKQIRNKNVKRILLTINNGEIQKIETELSGVLSVAEGKKIIETLALKNYNSIELYSMDGRILSFTRDR